MKQLLCETGDGGMDDLDYGNDLMRAMMMSPLHSALPPIRVGDNRRGRNSGHASLLAAINLRLPPDALLIFSSWSPP